MARPSSHRRAVAFALAAALAACSSSPRPPNRQPTTLAEINRALSWHLADVALTNEVVMRGLRGVEVTTERLLWTDGRGRRREMPIAEVTRIVLRGRDPAAQPPTEGARMLEAPDPPPETVVTPPAEGNFSALDGSTGAVVGVALLGLALAVDQVEEPGILIYEAPVTRYLRASPTRPTAEQPSPEDPGATSPPIER